MVKCHCKPHSYFCWKPDLEDILPILHWVPVCRKQTKGGSQTGGKAEAKCF